MGTSPAYFRARSALFLELIAAHEAKGPLLPLLRNGVLPPDMDTGAAVRTLMAQRAFPGHPLGFAELCAFNTFFALYPEKVCGVEALTSSREFPLTIKGDRQDVERTIGLALDPRLLLPPPAPWRIHAFESDGGTFEVEYRAGAKQVLLTDNGEHCRTESYEEGQLLQERHFPDAQGANAYLLTYMGHTSPPLDTLEALALQLEPQLELL